MLYSNIYNYTDKHGNNYKRLSVHTEMPIDRSESLVQPFTRQPFGLSRITQPIVFTFPVTVYFTVVVIYQVEVVYADW